MARVAADQIMFAPIMIGVFLSTMATLEGGSPSEKLRSTYLPALTTNWTFWPIVQAGNFWLTPVQYRLLLVNVVNLGNRLECS